MRYRTISLLAVLISSAASADSCTIADKKAAVVEAIKNNFVAKANDDEAEQAAEEQEKKQGYTDLVSRIYTKPVPLPDVLVQQFADNALVNAQDSAFTKKHSLKAPYVFHSDPSYGMGAFYETMMLSRVTVYNSEKDPEDILPKLISSNASSSWLGDHLDQNNIVELDVSNKDIAASVILNAATSCPPSVKRASQAAVTVTNQLNSAPANNAGTQAAQTAAVTNGKPSNGASGGQSSSEATSPSKAGMTQ